MGVAGSSALLKWSMSDGGELGTQTQLPAVLRRRRADIHTGRETIKFPMQKSMASAQTL